MNSNDIEQKKEIASVFERIHKACEKPDPDATNICSVVDLEPEEGWDGNSLVPAQYAGKNKTPNFHIEKRNVGGNLEKIAVFDSIQSCASRCEEACLEAIANNTLVMPTTKIFAGDQSRDILQISHRIYGAEAQLCKHNGQEFKESLIGRLVYSSEPADFLPILAQVNPTALTFGYWWSHLGPKGKAIRMARIYTSEIYGKIADDLIKLSGSKLDTFGMGAADDETIKNFEKMKGKSIEVTEGNDEKNKLSNFGLGNIAPSVLDNMAVSAFWIKEKTNISLTSAFQIATTIGGKQLPTDAVVALRVLAICQALHLHRLRVSQGYFLRSRCRLRIVKGAPQLYCWNRCPRDSFQLTNADSKYLYELAVKNIDQSLTPCLRKQGLPNYYKNNEVLELQANELLSKLILANYTTDTEGKTVVKGRNKGKKPPSEMSPEELQ